MSDTKLVKDQWDTNLLFSDKFLASFGVYTYTWGSAKSHTFAHSWGGLKKVINVGTKEVNVRECDMQTHPAKELITTNFRGGKKWTLNFAAEKECYRRVFWCYGNSFGSLLHELQKSAIELQE